MMLSQSEAVKIIDLIKKLAEKRYEGDGMYPYASFEFNGRYPQLYVKTEPDKWDFFTDDEHVGKVGRNYKPIAEGIKLLEELTND
jgi:hypothetical protein